MSDSLSPEKRSWNMSQIRGQDTKIEILVRRFLFSKGFRFRKNDKRYPGKPDVVLPKYKTVIFINGCFWHRHEGCKDATVPKTRTDFWISKLNKNVENDRKNRETLVTMGWRVITLWECELESQFELCMERTINQILEETGLNEKGLRTSKKETGV